MINSAYLCKKLMRFNGGKYFFKIMLKITFCMMLKKLVVVPAKWKWLFPALPVNFVTKEKSHQALIFFCPSSCSKKLVEHHYFVYIIQLKELCIALKKITAAVVLVWQNITFNFFIYIFLLWKAFFFILDFLNLLCIVYSWV